MWKNLLVTFKPKGYTKNYHSENVFGYKRKRIRLPEVSSEKLTARSTNCNLNSFVNAYRQHGHKKAQINPVAFDKKDKIISELNPKRYDLTAEINVNGLLPSNVNIRTLPQLIEFLENVYCQNITAEFLHLEEECERDWFAEQMETLHNKVLDKKTKIRILHELLKSQNFDNFLASKFVSFKRYGGEGAESMLAFFVELLNQSAKGNLEQIVLGMPHRGRLNLLTGLFEVPPQKLFRKLRGLPDFSEELDCTGDVASHMINSVDLNWDDKKVHVTTLYNPSHLEAVNPVSMGKTRSKQMFFLEGDYGNDGGLFGDKILNIQVHGDAAYAGQGINQECLNLSKAPHFEIGGTIHLVVNNQVGFTTPCDRGRSSNYCTDLAKMISVPVIHVNGDDPEKVVQATQIAFEYQRKFRKDVFIDMNCFRKWGHNELDDPTFTNPLLYEVIRSKQTVPDSYAKRLKEENLITDKEIDEILTEHWGQLSEAVKEAESYRPKSICFENQWSGFEQVPKSILTWDTGIHPNILSFVGVQSVTCPEDFNMHPHLEKTHVRNRLAKISDGANIDWATAEALAFGSLLYQGHNVRISGQDVGRGTFSHRHAQFVDQKTNEVHIPLNHLKVEKQGYLELANSILSEEAVLGYEYGMSIDNPNNLIIWEAQFGDFFTGAQIIIDTYISSGEKKWVTCSGLVMLLPHGYDGAGPEHSSCRIERFLQLTDSAENRPDGDHVNMHVVNPTTPAQYFHLLRQQIIPNYRKPLIVVAPKTLLRLSDAVSTYSEMAPGTSFHPVLDDTTVTPSDVQTVIFVSGKHFYALKRQRAELGRQNVAIVRLESLCPFPVHDLRTILDKYTKAKNFLWSQEEHRNMGAWSFINPRFQNLLGIRLRYSGRDVAATPAVGVSSWHASEAEFTIKDPFKI